MVFPLASATLAARLQAIAPKKAADAGKVEPKKVEPKKPEPAKADGYEKSARKPATPGPAPKAAPSKPVDPKLAAEAKHGQRMAHAQTRTQRQAKPAAPKVDVSKDDAGRTIVKGTSGDDKITVRNYDAAKDKDLGTGKKAPELVIEVNGEKTGITKKQAQRLIVDAGDGNDTVVVDASVKRGVGLLGGKGNDVLVGGSGDDKIDGGEGSDQILAGKGNDHVFVGKGGDKNYVYGGEGDDLLVGGDGDDFLHGEQGDDKLLGGKGKDTLIGAEGDDYAEGGEGDDEIYGGKGRDVLYGSAGNDKLVGEEDSDYLDGGKGDDTLEGRDGDDKLMGGRGKDKLRGGSGKDVLAGGYDVDDLDGGDGKDKLYVQKDDAVAGTGDDREEVDLSGDTYATQPGRKVAASRLSQRDGYADRIDDDLDTLRALPSGRKLLSALDKEVRDGEYVFIRGLDEKHDGHMATGSGKKGDGSDVYVEPSDSGFEDKSADWKRTPMIVGMYHELKHSLQYARGAEQHGRKTGGVDNMELDAVGLPYDHDKNKKTPNYVPGYDDLNENSLRKDLGYDARPEY